MKKILITISLIFCIISNLFAKDGFKINFNIKNVEKNEMIYLAHYYGKAGTIYKDDSIGISNENSQIEFNSNKIITGGIYMLHMSNSNKIFEFYLMNGDVFSIEFDINDIWNKSNTNFDGEGENIEFFKYQMFLNSNKISNLSDQEKSKEINKYRYNIIVNLPNTFTSKLFSAIYDIKFEKNKFLENYDFNDDRLIYTPTYQVNLDKYLDAILKDEKTYNENLALIISKCPYDKLHYQYTLWYLTFWNENNKNLINKKAFVYLVENYYLKNKASWVSNKVLDKYLKNSERLKVEIKQEVTKQENYTSKLTLTEGDYILKNSSSEYFQNYRTDGYYKINCGKIWRPAISENEWIKLNGLKQTETDVYYAIKFNLDGTAYLITESEFMADPFGFRGKINNLDNEIISKNIQRHKLATIGSKFDAMKVDFKANVGSGTYHWKNIININVPRENTGKCKISFNISYYSSYAINPNNSETKYLQPMEAEYDLDFIYYEKFSEKFKKEQSIREKERIEKENINNKLNAERERIASITFEKNRIAKLKTSEIGDRICYSQDWTHTTSSEGFFGFGAFENKVNYKMMVICYIERKEGNKYQVRVANIQSSDGKNYSTPDYKGVKMNEGSIHWISPLTDKNWLICE